MEEKTTRTKYLPLTAAANNAYPYCSLHAMASGNQALAVRYTNGKKRSRLCVKIGYEDRGGVVHVHVHIHISMHFYDSTHNTIVKPTI